MERTSALIAFALLVAIVFAGGYAAASSFPSGGNATANFTGDTGTGGIAGLVPAPAAGDGAAGKILRANGTWGRDTLYAARLYRSASQPITAGSIQYVSWNQSLTPNVNAGSLWTSGTDVTIPVTGIYSINWLVDFAATGGAVGLGQNFVTLNGATLAYGTDHDGNLASASSTYSTGSCCTYLTTGDVLKLGVYTSANTNVQGSQLFVALVAQ